MTTRAGAVLGASAGVLLMVGAGIGHPAPGAVHRIERSGTPRMTAAPLAGALSAEQLAGERVIYAYAGLRPPARLLGLLRAGAGAGVILFADNIASAGQVAAAVRSLQAAARAGPEHRRILVMTDQEGGEVRRLPGGPALSERSIGQSADPAAAAAAAGREAAAALRAADVNVNLAPVLDVLRRPGDFIDRPGRSYSSRPAVVSVAGAAFIRAEQEEGVAATVKHFPGLGAASANQDTDAGPVRLDTPLADIRAIDEAPYPAAIRAQVKLVMLSWATYPHLSGTVPAGLSPAVIVGELRHRLRFRGVTISDAFGAGAVASSATGRRAVAVARAGVDLILCSVSDPSKNSPALGEATFDAVASAIRTGALPRAAAVAAAGRVLALRDAP